MTAPQVAAFRDALTAFGISPDGFTGWLRVHFRGGRALTVEVFERAKIEASTHGNQRKDPKQSL